MAQRLMIAVSRARQSSWLDSPSSVHDWFGLANVDGAHEAIKNGWAGLEIRAFHRRISQSGSRKTNTRIRNAFVPFSFSRALPRRRTRVH